MRIFFAQKIKTESKTKFFNSFITKSQGFIFEEVMKFYAPSNVVIHTLQRIQRLRYLKFASS